MKFVTTPKSLIKQEICFHKYLFVFFYRSKAPYNTVSKLLRVLRGDELSKAVASSAMLHVSQDWRCFVKHLWIQQKCLYLLGFCQILSLASGRGGFLLKKERIFWCFLWFMLSFKSLICLLSYKRVKDWVGRIWVYDWGLA